MDPQRLRKLAGRQFGVFTRAQARGLGYSAYQIRRRLAEGEWRVVLGSGLALAGATVTPMARDRAAQLSVGGSVLAGASAARTWQVEAPDDRPCLYVGPHGGTRLRGIRLIYETPAVRDVSLFQGLPTTSRACAVVDCLRFLPEPAALAFLDRALQKGWLGVDELTRRVHETCGARGPRPDWRLVRQVRDGERSASERRLTSLLDRAGIGGWQVNAEIRDRAGLIGFGDVVFGRARVVVEVDGWAYHSTPDRFQRDRRRQNRLVGAGWIVLRFTWADLRDRPQEVVATIRRLV